MKTVLSIAGSDCSGGAGIQADIKTITAFRMYAMSAITALTAQNTTGVKEILPISPKFVASQLDAVFTDIYPDAVKIGMIFDAQIATEIAKKLRQYKAINIVLDPVMCSTSGDMLISPGTKNVLVKELFPLARLITPNKPEAEVLGESVINAFPTLIKGGHSDGEPTDVLNSNGKLVEFTGTRIHTRNTHGTGCTLSTAIACGLADGQDLVTSIRNAKRYVHGALGAGLRLGHGAGPIDHTWHIK